MRDLTTSSEEYTPDNHKDESHVLGENTVTQTSEEVLQHCEELLHDPEGGCLAALRFAEKFIQDSSGKSAKRGKDEKKARGELKRWIHEKKEKIM